MNPSPPASAAALRDFAAWMAELDAVQALRAQDPARALARVLALNTAVTGLPEAETALVQARRTLQIGASCLQLGRHAQAQRELHQLALDLGQPALQRAAPELRRQAQRCGIAGANAQAVLSHALGDFAGALRAYLHALDLAVTLGDLRFQAHVLVNLSNTYEECGLPAEALEHSRQALDMAQALAMDELVGDIHHNIGNALAASGDLEAGLASNRRALDAYAALQLPQKESYALVAVAERLLELGRPAEAAAALRDREQRALNFVNHQYVAYAAYLQGRIASAQGQPDAARQAFGQALAVSAGQLDDRVGQARARLELARLDLAASRLLDAGRQAEAALALLAPSQAQRDLMQAHSLLSAVAKAQGDLTAALRHHEAFHAGYERCFNEESARKARVLAVRHEVDLARGEAQRQRLENARLTEALAAIAARLQRGEGSSPPSGAAQPVRAEDLQALGLTPREAEVLFWVTQGKTNDDVTVILGTSVSAVKKHLGRIYDKLGVENRTAAANAARRARPGPATVPGEGV
jgi:ATP/maltotriose-dependent transcriptional regulator MalT